MKLSVMGNIDFGKLPLWEGIDIEKNDAGVNITVSTQEGMEKFKAMLAPVITDSITENYEKEYIGRTVSARCRQFTAEERRRIYEEAVKKAGNLPPEKRKKFIKDKLYEFLKTSDTLSVDGFVNFRLGEYKSRLETVVDDAADEYLAEREYGEFIGLLKYFVELQEVREPLVHVVLRQNGTYVIYNERKKDITGRCVEEFLNTASTYEMNYDDMLLSSLITLAPLKIIMHGFESAEDKDVTDTIRQVFTGRIVFCEGCRLCEKIN